VLERLELDTAFFKGNAPQAVVVEAIDEEAPSTERLRTLGGWPVLVSKTPLVQHKKHILEPERPMTVTHLRVHIFPHGGVNRLRAFGHAVDTVDQTVLLDRFNRLPEGMAVEFLKSMCGSSTWANTLASQRPFASVKALSSSMEQVFWTLSEADLLEAFSAHPQIGDRHKAASATALSASWSSTEQTGMASATSSTAEKMAALNAQYAQKNGFIYIVCASGRSSADLLRVLEGRIDNDRATELDLAAREQMKITRLRLEKWLSTSTTSTTSTQDQQKAGS
jgi:allantoicase